MDEHEKKIPPKDNNGKEHNVPLEAEEIDEVEGSVREPGPEDDNGATGGGTPEEGASDQTGEGSEGEAGPASEADRLRSIGYPSISELRAYLKRCYKHVTDGEVPVVVMIGNEPYWYPITNVEAIQNAKDNSQAVVITLMPKPGQAKPEPAIEVVKTLPKEVRGPNDVN